MKRKSIWFIVGVLLLSFIACSGEKQKSKTDKETLAKINNYKLSYQEFQRELAEELNYDPSLKLTKETKKRFLNQLIQEQLLIQEAKKLKLDRQEAFIRAIERYWKSTLIKDLLEKKGREISKTILVSQEEVEAYYNKLKKSGQRLPPLAKIRDKLVKELKEKKKREKLKQWMEQLRKKADIEINSDLLNKD